MLPPNLQLKVMFLKLYLQPKMMCESPQAVKLMFMHALFLLRLFLR